MVSYNTGGLITPWIVGLDVQVIQIYSRWRVPHIQMKSNILMQEVSVEKTPEEKKKFAKIIAKAWVDEEFKTRLLDDPATVLKENGIEIPEGMTVKVVEQKENEICFMLPPKPANLKGPVEELYERIEACCPGPAA